MAGNYAAYLVELALPDYGMLKYSYSMVAAAAVQLTNRCPRGSLDYLLSPVFKARRHRGKGHGTMTASACVACSAGSYSCL